MKTNIDFLVHSNPYWLNVLDFSYWGLIENKPSIIEVTLPGYATPVVKYFDKFKNNGFNSILLEINCESECGDVNLVTLPDGIYTITVKGSPSKFQKTYHYLKTDLLQMELDKILISAIDTDQYYKIDSKLIEIEFLLKGAEAHLRSDLIRVAGNMFQKAVELTEKLRDCKTC
jgi:hypothetical protein